jgi:hypothetical protein
MKAWIELILLAIFLSGIVTSCCLFKPQRWAEGDPRLTPAASGSPVVLERIEIGIGISESGSTK